MKEFLKKKDIEISLKRYGIDALGAMAQGLFCSLLIGTIIDTVETQFGIPFLTMTVATIKDVPYTVGGLAAAMSGPAMAVAIGHALKCPPLVLFSMITVGFSANALGGAGGPLAVLFIAIIAVVPSILFSLTGNVLMQSFGGTSVLILVGVAMDTISQLESQLKMHNYEGIFKYGRALLGICRTQRHQAVGPRARPLFSVCRAWHTPNG